MDKHITVWTCDRCGERKEVDRAGQPHGWYGLEVVSPPRAEFKGARTALCQNCKRDFDWWYRNIVTAVTDAEAVSA